MHWLGTLYAIGFVALVLSGFAGCAMTRVSPPATLATRIAAADIAYRRLPASHSAYNAAVRDLCDVLQTGARQPWIKPQLRRAEANPFLEELEGLLLRKAIEEPHEGYLVGKAKSVMRAPAPAELHEIFLGQGRGPLELFVGSGSGGG